MNVYEASDDAYIVFLAFSHSLMSISNTRFRRCAHNIAASLTSRGLFFFTLSGRPLGSKATIRREYAKNRVKLSLGFCLFIDKTCFIHNVSGYGAVNDLHYRAQFTWVPF